MNSSIQVHFVLVARLVQGKTFSFWRTDHNLLTLMSLSDCVGELQP
jgi:hypothetical protein